VKQPKLSLQPLVYDSASTFRVAVCMGHLSSSNPILLSCKLLSCHPSAWHWFTLWWCHESSWHWDPEDL